MPYVPGHEEDGFLKKLDVSPADIEPKANWCTQVRIHLINERVVPPIFVWLINYNDDIHAVRARVKTQQIFVWHTQTKSNTPANRTTATGKRYKGTNIDTLQEWIV